MDCTSLLFFLGTSLSILCVGGVYSVVARDGGCVYIPIFRTSLTTLLSIAYYMVVKMVESFLSFMLSEATSATRRCKGALLTRATNNVYGECPVQKEVYTIEEVDEEEDREEDEIMEGVPIVQSSSMRIWSNVYGLGVGVYCLVFSVQSTDVYVGFVLSVCLVLIAVQEYAYGPRATPVHGRVSVPVCILLYLASLVLVAKSMTPRTALHWVTGALIPIVGAGLIRYMQRPSNLVETLKLSAPVSGMIGVCCVFVVGASGGMDCVIVHYFMQGVPPGSFVRIDPTAMTLFFVSPVLCACALGAGLAACSKRRTLDLASGAVTLAVLRAYFTGHVDGLVPYGVSCALLGSSINLFLRASDLRKEVAGDKDSVCVYERGEGEEMRTMDRDEPWTPYPTPSPKKPASLFVRTSLDE